MFALGAIVFQVTSLVVVWRFATNKSMDFLTPRRAVATIFAVSLLAMLGSLFYSNIVGFEPCVMCWYQRICMFSIPCIAGTAMRRSSSNDIFYYTRVLSLIGGIFALYHSYIKFTGNSPLPCSAFGVSAVDCTKQLVVKFGYINIPMMAFSAFVLVYIISYVMIKRSK